MASIHVQRWAGSRSAAIEAMRGSSAATFSKRSSMSRQAHIRPISFRSRPTARQPRCANGLSSRSSDCSCLSNRRHGRISGVPRLCHPIAIGPSPNKERRSNRHRPEYRSPNVDLFFRTWSFGEMPEMHSSSFGSFAHLIGRPGALAPVDDAQVGRTTMGRASHAGGRCPVATR